MLLPLPEMSIIFLVAIGCSVVIGALGVVALWLFRRRSLRVRLVIIVATTLSSVLAGMIAISAAMYLSEHDLYVFFTVAFASFLSTMVVTWVLGRLIAREYRDLKTLTAEVGEGRRLGASHDPKDVSETAQVKAELISTSQKLADARDEVAALDRSRRELIAWIAHDLRTPMAGLKAMAEALEDGMVDDPTRYHEKIKLQVDRLSHMVDDLFALSRIQSGNLELDSIEISLYDLVSDTVADLRPIAESKGISVEALGLQDVVVTGDPRELTRVVENLLMNALQHSPKNAEVVLETSRNGQQQAVLTVSDAGGGVPNAALTEIFVTGWRGTPSRTPEDEVLTAGAGLGLAIVRGIVEAHAGTVGVSNTPAGARFEVRLPAAAPMH
ncbi:sensor histidine kinase KdpD [Brevibacterium aurantiacum]|uniref:Sensor-like histidine kinase SenX3 n=1 Tax=Brevibacterium aurantiacum TaxID=273384 RepID=A0A556CQ28_BREAU|nr:HAMP domain-containing sensor histidine kinase [Brevibacterium aurantiacum]TSI19545.1 HAMP domain-containing histidine kinase [Brevibacterium aurantiacum]